MYLPAFRMFLLHASSASGYLTQSASILLVKFIVFELFKETSHFMESEIYLPSSYAPTPDHYSGPD